MTESLFSTSIFRHNFIIRSQRSSYIPKAKKFFEFMRSESCLDAPKIKSCIQGVKGCEKVGRRWTNGERQQVRKEIKNQVWLELKPFLCYHRAGLNSDAVA